MSSKAAAGIITAGAAAAVAAALSLSSPNSKPVLPAIPGAVQHRWSQEWICEHGTRQIRPPVSYTNRLKRSQLPPGADPHDYEEDHLIPLSVGGNPRSPNNLWPEPWPQAHAADKIEYREYREVCAGLETQAQGQKDVLDFKRRNG